MCSLYEMLAIAFNLKNGLSTGEKTTEFWVYATTYKGLSCYFYKAENILASQKTLIQSVPFLIPLSIPLLYIVCEGKKILIMGGVPVRGEGEQGERAKKTDGLD